MLFVSLPTATAGAGTHTARERSNARKMERRRQLETAASLKAWKSVISAEDFCDFAAGRPTDFLGLSLGLYDEDFDASDSSDDELEPEALREAHELTARCQVAFALHSLSFFLP
jgi:hypothetical protein